MTAPKPTREPSLLERAAKIYDFSAHVRAPAMPPPLAMPAPKAAPAPADAGRDDAPTVYDEALLASLAAIPAEFRASDGDDADEILPFSGATALVDRAMLAERGMIVPGAPVGSLAEEFRLVKRQLLATAARVAAGAQADKARMILVCSGRPGDGKTFCAINLALSLAAERDTEVLLVDADFAKPDVLAQLGITDSPGLLDALADSGVDPESLVLHTDVPHLSILPTGARNHADTELLASGRTRTVIARLLAANPRRIILFDSPPALAASPASVLATLVGQVMMVVRADRTTDGDVRESVALLDGCEHIQLLLNAVSFVPGGHRYGTYYGQEALK